MSFTIYTAASGLYTHYAPYFEYCARLAYPDATVRVDILDNIPCLYYAACYRLLNCVPGDQVYVTDVDMLLLNPPNLFDFHTNMMAETGLPYSNSPRKREFRGDERLTGLHFCTPEWYKATAETRKRYMGRIDRGEYGTGRFDDELMLMAIAKESGMEIPPRQKLIGMHFGVHLGTIRAYRHKSRETLRTQLAMRISPEQALQMCEVMDSGMYDIKAGSRIVREELQTLEAFCRARCRQ